MEDLQYATGLKDLRLTRSQLSSAIEFSGLTDLEFLFLDHNNIAGDINLVRNTNLVSVWLSYNRMTGLMLPEAPNLRTLKAHTNQLEYVTTTGPLRELTEFSIGNNNLTSIDPTDIGGRRIGGKTFGAETHVNLHGNQLTSLGIPGAAKFQALDISSNQLSSLDLPWTLPDLREVFVRSNNLTSWPSLGSTGKPTRLDMAYNELTNGGNDSDPAVFYSGTNFPVLTDLWLSGNRLKTL